MPAWDLGRPVSASISLGKEKSTSVRTIRLRDGIGSINIREFRTSERDG